MVERLANGDFNNLSLAIWDIGRLSMAHIFEATPLPARVGGVIQDGELYVEPQFELRERMIDGQMRMPSLMKVTISEAEPYKLLEDFTLYSSETLALNLNTRSRTFERSITIMDEFGNSIVPALHKRGTQIDHEDMGRRNRPPYQSWLEVTDNSSLSFGRHEAQRFLKTLFTVTKKIRSGEIQI